MTPATADIVITDFLKEISQRLDESVSIEREAIVNAVVAFQEKDRKVFRLKQRRLTRREPGHHLSRHPQWRFQLRQY